MGGKESSATDVNNAFSKLASLKSCVVAYPETQGQQETVLTSGEAWLLPFSDGRLFGLKNNGSSVDFSYIPYTVASRGDIGIVNGTKNMDLAVKFVDFWLSAQLQQEFFEVIRFSPTNTQAKMSASFNSQIHYGADVLASLVYPDYGVIYNQRDSWINQWNTIFAA